MVKNNKTNRFLRTCMNSITSVKVFLKLESTCLENEFGLMIFPNDKTSGKNVAKIPVVEVFCMLECRYEQNSKVLEH